jgi:signal transduction histidine kinase
MAGTHLDISARKAAEAERAELLARSARAERGAALGTLAAGMAHEINNPLTPVLAGIDFVKDQLGSLPAGCLAAWRASATSSIDEVQGALEDAGRGARRVRDLVADLRSFALGQHAADSQCDLAGAVERAVRVAHHALADGTSISLDLPKLPPVAGSEAELVQLFACLLVNAEQASGDRPNKVRVSAERRGGLVVVRVSDTGKGIAQEHMPRIFEPFFTTRSVGQGKGLGLPVAQGIAQGLGGSIEVQSAGGGGTTVTVTLPAGTTG